MTFDLVEHILRHGFKRLLLAVSGGLDSICLAHYFIENSEALGIEWLGIAHVHHGLREGTADRDAKFVEEFAKSHNVPFFLKRLDGEALKAAEGSLEENARDARYKALVEIALDPSTSLYSAQDDTTLVSSFDKLRTDYSSFVSHTPYPMVRQKVGEPVEPHQPIHRLATDPIHQTPIAIVTAHHANDQAETMLMRIKRGTTLAGLRGIQALRQYFDKLSIPAQGPYRFENLSNLTQDDKREKPDQVGHDKAEKNFLPPTSYFLLKIYRPFLHVTRAELLAYARENSLSWCEDESNADVKFARNKIRHELLPNLERECPGATKQLCRIAELADRANAKVMEKCESVFAPCLSNKESLDPIAKCNPRNNGWGRPQPLKFGYTHASMAATLTFRGCPIGTSCLQDDRLQDDAIKDPSTSLRSAQDDTEPPPFNTAQDNKPLVSRQPAKRSLVLNTPYPMVRQKVGEPVEPHQPILRLATDTIPHTSISLDKKKLNKILREHAKADLSEVFRLWLSEQGFRFPIGFFYGPKEPAHVKIPVRAVYRKRAIVKIGHKVWICEFKDTDSASKFVSCEMKEKDYNEQTQKAKRSV